MNDLDELRDRIGALSVEALRRGGEAMLDRVEAELGVAIRHSQRIQEGVLPFSKYIRRDMEASIERAEHLLDVNARPLIGL